MSETNLTLKERLAAVEERIAAACARAGRPREDVTLIAVSKTHPAEEVLHAMQAGQLVFGENRVQELKEKALRVGELLADSSAGNPYAGLRERYAQVPGQGITWHLIGTLQTNKVKYLPGIIDVNGGLIHSVDNLKLAREIDARFGACFAKLREASAPDAGAAQEDARALPRQEVLLEVNMAQEETKAGLAPEDVPALLREIAPLSHLRVRGLMTIAPFTEDAETNRIHFKGLRELLDDLNRQAVLPEPMTELSMGMSGDYEVAIEEGATFIRVGTAIFGERFYPA
ncbi:MAG: YggS family pyridoxal phosphate-dependent enzyme [Lachnospiraceae bacterium]|nr:YggS family pyridoxal phosphate-dependent enzyme [Lachnospiraceae bacterium]